MVIVTLLSLQSYAQQGLRNSEALDDLFTIRAIKIDETEKSASKAREKGLAKAESYAFDRLMGKILSTDDFHNLPPLSVAEKQSMMRGIDIVSEQRSSRRYIAEINISFEPVTVSQWLADLEIPHVLGAGTGLLVLHAHRDNVDEYFGEAWDMEKSILASIWKLVDHENRLRTYNFPKGGLDDRLMYSYGQVLEQDSEAAALMAKNYNMDGALLISTQFKAAIGHLPAQVDYQYYLTATATSGEGEITASRSDENVTVAAINKILDEVDGVWRSQLLISSGVQGELELVLPTIDLKVLVKITDAVKNMSLVRDWTVLEVGVPLTKAHMSYTGRRDQLDLALTLAGLTIRPYGGVWMLDIK